MSDALVLDKNQVLAIVRNMPVPALLKAGLVAGIAAMPEQQFRQALEVALTSARQFASGDTTRARSVLVEYGLSEKLADQLVQHISHAQNPNQNQ